MTKKIKVNPVVAVKYENQVVQNCRGDTIFLSTYLRSSYKWDAYDDDDGDGGVAGDDGGDDDEDEDVEDVYNPAFPVSDIILQIEAAANIRSHIFLYYPINWLIDQGVCGIWLDLGGGCFGHVNN